MSAPTPFATARGEGMCSRCGWRPKYHSPGGQRYSWCLACRTEVEKYRKRGLAAPPPPPPPEEEPVRMEQTVVAADPQVRPCAKCGVRPREVDYLGRVKTHCAECRRESKRAWYQRNHSVAARAAKAEQALAPVGDQSLIEHAERLRPTPAPQPEEQVYGVVARMVVAIEEARPMVSNTEMALHMALELPGSRIRMSVEGKPDAD